jgi:8-oxo-dGTP diphosphatase
LNGLPARVLVAAAIILRGEEVLLARRPEGKHLAGLWELPGGKVEPQESPEEALAREVREELGIEIRGVRPYLFVHHRYPEKRILMLTYLCEAIQEPGQGETAWRWQRISEIDPNEMPEADRGIIEALQDGRRR